LNLKDHFRHWRDHCLQSVDKKILDLEAFISGYEAKEPASRRPLKATGSEAAKLQRQVAADLAKGKGERCQERRREVAFWPRVT